MHCLYIEIEETIIHPENSSNWRCLRQRYDPAKTVNEGGVADMDDPNKKDKLDQLLQEMFLEELIGIENPSEENMEEAKVRVLEKIKDEVDKRVRERFGGSN
jgi:hypothetical protein